jgi:hypothetical protein
VACGISFDAAAGHSLSRLKLMIGAAVRRDAAEGLLDLQITCAAAGGMGNGPAVKRLEKMLLEKLKAESRNQKSSGKSRA